MGSSTVRLAGRRVLILALALVLRRRWSSAVSALSLRRTRGFHVLSAFRAVSRTGKRPRLFWKRSWRLTRSWKKQKRRMMTGILKTAMALYSVKTALVPTRMSRGRSPLVSSATLPSGMPGLGPDTAASPVTTARQSTAQIRPLSVLPVIRSSLRTAVGLSMRSMRIGTVGSTVGEIISRSGTVVSDSFWFLTA